MTGPADPRLYLVTPAVFDSGVPDRVAALIEGFDVACVRLALATTDEDDLSRAADLLRSTCHARDVPLVVTDHFRLAKRLGLDGVHLSSGARKIREARKELGSDSIVGAFAGASRHDGLTAAEIGADYVSFGPITPSTLGDGTTAPPDIFHWWAEMIEVPVVAEGGLTPETVAALAPHADFLALGDELWRHPQGPEAALRAILGRVAA